MAALVHHSMAWNNYVVLFSLSVTLTELDGYPVGGLVYNITG